LIIGEHCKFKTGLVLYSVSNCTSAVLCFNPGDVGSCCDTIVFLFFFILPVLLFINLISFVYLSIKDRTISRNVLVYFILSLVGIGIFSFAISRGCLVSV